VLSLILIMIKYMQFLGLKKTKKLTNNEQENTPSIEIYVNCPKTTTGPHKTDSCPRIQFKELDTPTTLRGGGE
jgi:hypothetical protein